MSGVRVIVLGDRVFEVPDLPFRISIDAYPICQKLTDSGVSQRITDAIKNDTGISVSRDELVDLGEVAFLGCKAAEKDFTREEFDELPIKPLQLCLSFLAIKVQTGAWVVSSDDTENPDTGEANGADQPPI